jgi:hypothetical protein
MVVGLVCFGDPPCYTGAPGRASHARLVGSEKPDKEATNWLSGLLRVGHRANNLTL